MRNNYPPRAPIATSQATQFLRSQVFFEPNEGQSDKSVSYLSYGLGYSLFLTPDATMVIPTRATAGDPVSAVRLSILGANPSAEIVGLDKQLGKSNYFAGSDPKLWHTGISHFGRVEYRNIHPGIDLIFYAKDGSLEYDFVLAPHADPSGIRMKVEGAHLSLADNGDALIGFSPNGPIRLNKPRVFAAGDEARPIPARYKLHGDELSLSLAPMTTIGRW